MNNMTDDMVVNMDETNVYFDMHGEITLARRGERTISVRTTGSNARCTVCLAVSKSGVKLPPLVIFKGKRNGRIVRELTHYTNSLIYVDWIVDAWESITAESIKNTWDRVLTDSNN